MRRMRLQSSFGSHLPVLIKLMSVTSGPVLELGSGLYSTPYLHWECYRTGRRLVTFESDPRYYALASAYHKGAHEVRFVPDWDTLDLSEPWSVAFVDHHPSIRRGIDTMRLTHADYVVAHDALDSRYIEYGYNVAFAQFKYQYRYKRAVPYTMVLSNRWDLAYFTVAK